MGSVDLSNKGLRPCVLVVAHACSTSEPVPTSNFFRDQLTTTWNLRMRVSIMNHARRCTSTVGGTFPTPPPGGGCPTATHATADTALQYPYGTIVCMSPKIV